ncbi:MAG: asparagine synthase (glutamine-hydrolyzing) [Porticoccaceae bacterium]
MCGLNAIYAYHPSAPPVDRGELLRVRDRMRARGPDGEGAWYSPDGRVGLGHRRLAIIDLDPRAAQPMASADGLAVLSFNGEIYNFRSLRAELVADGLVPRTESDSEVLIELYRRHGEAMLARLRGMYAFALWDAKRAALLLARDPYGIKPLYYADDGWSVRVASQVKALLASPQVSRLPEPAGQVGFALFGSVPEPFTLWQEIRALPAGHLAWVDETGVQMPRAHWHLADAFVRNDAAIDEETLLGHLRDSVSAHRVSDVPVGVFLSAGVDSSALLGGLSDTGGGPVTAITIGFDEFQGQPEDEVPLAREIASRYGARHIVRRVDAAEFAADLPAILDAMDQPSIDGFNSWFAAKAAREAGLKVMLSGIGGDELFGGYDSFRDLPRWRRLMAPIAALRPLAIAMRAVLAALLPRLGLPPKAAGLPELGGTWAGAYLLRRGVFLPWELKHLLPDDVVAAGLYRLQWQALIDQHLAARLPNDHSRVAVLESGLYLRNQLLRDSDWASMAHGVELRTPLVDALLLNQTASAAAGLGRSGGKRLLARLPKLPLRTQIVERPKTGFTTPIAGWLQSSEPLQGWRRLRILRGERVQVSRRLVAALLAGS